MAIREVIVTSLGDLIAEVTPTEPDPATGRRRGSGIYCGGADASLSLLTSLDQLGGSDAQAHVDLVAFVPQASQAPLGDALGDENAGHDPSLRVGRLSPRLRTAAARRARP